MTYSLNREKHIKYLERHLYLLPSSHQQYDINKMAIIFYSIMGLAALDVDVADKYKSNVPWLHEHYSTSEISNSPELISGFVGSLSMKVASVNTFSLPNTLFALLTLKVLNDQAFINNTQNRRNIANFVAKCQSPSDGSFSSVLDCSTAVPSPVDSKDLRFCYIAVAILHIMGCKSEEHYAQHIDVEKLVQYILSQECDVGGFGTYGEPHAGYTSCALSALTLLGQIDRLTVQFKRRTTSWLVSRQVSSEGCMRLQEGNEYYDIEDHGGFQGRENKFADTCYVFWCLNSLKILNAERTEYPFDPKLAEQYLLQRTQNNLIGGFSKNDEDSPDLYHTCLGIASLKLIQGTFDGVLFFPQSFSTD